MRATVLALQQIVGRTAGGVRPQTVESERQVGGHSGKKVG